MAKLRIQRFTLCVQRAAQRGEPERDERTMRLLIWAVLLLVLIVAVQTIGPEMLCILIKLVR